MRSSATGRIGITMLLGGVFLYAGLKYWVDTRNFNPVSVPITLETGEIVQQKFTIDVGGEYWVNFQSPPDAWNYETVEEWRRVDSKLEIRDGSGKDVPIYSWDGTVTTSVGGSANLQRGQYSAKLVILNGSPLLSRYHPRLNIETDRTFPDFLVILSGWISAFVITAGLMLLIRRAMTVKQEKVDEDKAFASPPTGSYPSDVLLRRIRDKRQFAKPSQWELYSHWSLYLVCFLVLILVAEFAFDSFRYRARGVWVRVLPKQAQLIATKEPATPKLVLRVVCNKRELGYMIHDRLLLSADLKEELKQEVGSRRDWTVYVDGDPNCPFADVMDAADVIRGLQANVVLVTPASRDLIERDPQEPTLGQRPAIPKALRRSDNRQER